MRTARRYAGNRSGQALIEMAIGLPFLALLLAGVIDSGRFFNASIVLTNAAREAARYGISHPTDVAAIQNKALEEASNSGMALTASNVQVQTPSGTVGGQPLTVEVSQSLVTLMGGLFNLNRIPVRRLATMTIL